MSETLHKTRRERPAVIQGLVYNYLLNGGMYSVADISTALHISDPRSHIRCLRNKGFTILDEWRKGIYSRYKVYFVPRF